jgi:hypothetical protein
MSYNFDVFPSTMEAGGCTLKMDQPAGAPQTAPLRAVPPEWLKHHHQPSIARPSAVLYSTVILYHVSAPCFVPRRSIYLSIRSYVVAVGNEINRHPPRSPQLNTRMCPSSFESATVTVQVTATNLRGSISQTDKQYSYSTSTCRYPGWISADF